MNIIRTIAAVLALSVAAATWAVPAKRTWRTVTQADGTTLTVRNVGDENLHFTVTDDDMIVVYDKTAGSYCYGHINAADGALESSGVKAYGKATRPASHRYLTTSLAEIDGEKLLAKRGTSLRISPSVTAKEQELSANADVPQYGMGLFDNAYPTVGKVKALIILAEYSDVKFRGKESYRGMSAGEYFHDMVNQRGFSAFGGTGSVADYFEENSQGQFQPDFIVVGPVTLPNTMAYYGANDRDGNDVRAADMIADACRLVDDEVNFADFDNDGDGYCDNVFVFYAGQGEASYGEEDSVWPHAWAVSYGGIQLILDGVTIDSYACTNEWEADAPDGVGTFIHEYSHVLGLPDLYSTTNSLTCTPGSYSVLDYGPYNNDARTPPGYSIFERNALGWMKPELLEPGTGVSAELEDVLSSNQGYIVQTERENEFFLIENRQQRSWDTYIPGHGMLIWHVDYTKMVFRNNTVNDKRTHQYVDIIEANNTTSLSPSVMAGYTWPGTKHKTEYTAESTPAFLSWNGVDPGTPITGIAESDEGIITFDVCGGFRLVAPRLYPVEGAALGSNYFVASWEAVDGATDYVIDVVGIPPYEGVPEEEKATFEAADDTGGDTAAEVPGGDVSITIPAGWSGQSSEKGELAGSVNLYGVASPSMKFKDSSAYLQTKEYDCAISTVTFSFRGNLDKGSTLYLEGCGDDGWVKIWHDTQTTSDYEMKTVEVDVTDHMPNVKAVRFSFERAAGTLVLDDITVKTGTSASKPVPGYTNRSTLGGTSLRVSKLLDECDVYLFRVKAVNDDMESGWSDWGIVRMGSSSSKAIDADLAGGFSVTVNDRTITVHSREARVDLFDDSGRHVRSVATSDGQAKFTAPGKGLYIVKSGRDAAKVTTH